MLKVYNFNCVQALGPEWSWRVFFYFYFWNSLKGLLVYVNSVCKRLWLKLIRKVLNIRVGKLKKLLTMDVRRCSYELLNRLPEKFSSGSYSLKRKEKCVFFCKRLNWKKSGNPSLVLCLGNSFNALLRYKRHVIAKNLVANLHFLVFSSSNRVFRGSNPASLNILKKLLYFHWHFLIMGLFGNEVESLQ